MKSSSRRYGPHMSPITIPEVRRLPGPRTPRSDLLARVEEARRRVNPVFSFLVAEAADLTWFRVQLDCGCVEDAVGVNDRLTPHGRDTYDTPLPDGQWLCGTHRRATAPPEHRVVSWGKRRVVDFPADPEEPPAHLASCPEVWPVLRRPEPHSSAFWRVVLSCGHTTEVVSDLEWTVEEGPRPMIAPPRRNELLVELEKELVAARAGTSRASVATVEREIRFVEALCPTPNPVQDCYTCLAVRTITAFENAGPLVTAKQPVPTKRARLERQLELAEKDAAASSARAARLREALATEDA